MGLAVHVARFHGRDFMGQVVMGRVAMGQVVMGRVAMGQVVWEFVPQSLILCFPMVAHLFSLKIS
jgi:hypothetical protein